MAFAAAPAHAAPASYATAVLVNDPYVYHRFNETPLSNDTGAIDASLNGRSGVYKAGGGGALTSTSGDGAGSDAAVSLPGTGDGANGAYFGNPNVRGFGSRVGTSSYEFVFKTNPGFNTGSIQSLFGVFNPSTLGSHTDVNIDLNTRGNDSGGLLAYSTRLYIRAADGDAPGVHFVNPTLYDGNFHHLVFTFDQNLAGAAAYRAYVDGEEQPLTFAVVNRTTQDTNDDPDGFLDWRYDPAWGARNVRGALGSTSVNRLANVTIDEAALYAHVLDPAQVGLHAAAAIAVPEPGALALLALAGVGLMRRRRCA